MHVFCTNCGKLLDESDPRCWNCGAQRDVAPAPPQPQRPWRAENALPVIAGLGAGIFLAFVILVIDQGLYSSDTAASAWITVGLILIVGVILVLVIPTLTSIPHRVAAFSRWALAGAIVFFVVTGAGVLIWMGFLAVCRQLFKNV